MLELSVALSYLIPRRGRFSQSVTTLFAVFVISTIVWLTLVYFSTIGNIEERWAKKIESFVGTYELIPTPAYLQDPAVTIDQKTAKTSYTISRLSLHAHDQFPVWDEDTDEKLSYEQEEALSVPTPLHRLIELLNAQEPPFSWHVFEQQVSHAEFMCHDETLSQYIVLRGTKLNDRILFNMLKVRDLEPSEKTALKQLSRTLPSVNLEENRACLAADSQALSPITGKGYPFLLPLQTRKQGVRLFDQIVLDPSQSQITSIKGFVAGFYDPGILPIGSKLLLASNEVISLISPSLNIQEPVSLSGIAIDNPGHLSKDDLVKKLTASHLNTYFSLRSFDKSPMTEELFNQIKNEHTLFQLLSSILLLTASVNILSMLFIIARDRKKEIALFRALGMKRWRLSLLFSSAGFMTGLFSFFVGYVLASITLYFLPECLSFISWSQDRLVLDPTIFGTIQRDRVRADSTLFSALFVLISATFAGLGASLYATRISISEALKEP